MKVFITCLIFLFASVELHAQHFSKLRRFSIQYDQGCFPATVTVTQYASLDKPRSFWYEPGLADTPDTTHTYLHPGTYPIVQLIGQDANPKTDTLWLTLYAIDEPTYEIYKCDGGNNEAQLLITDSNYDRYRVYFNEADSATLLSGDTLLMNFTDNSGAIRVKGLLDSAYSLNCAESGSSIDFAQTFSPPTIDRLWVSHECNDLYTLHLNVSNLQPIPYEWVLTHSFDTLILHRGNMHASMVFNSLEHEQIVNACMTINAIDLCNDTKYPSPLYCLPAGQTTDQPFVNAYASYAESGVAIQLSQKPQNAVLLERQLNGNSLDSIALFHASSYQDRTVSFSHPSYHLTTLTDSCSANQYQVQLHPPYIKMVRRDLENNLIWLDTLNPLTNIPDYHPDLQIVLRNANETNVGSIPFSNPFQLIPSLAEIQYFYLQYTDEHATIRSNTLTARANYIIHVPKAFTPHNHDGLNDHLEFFGLPTKTAELEIYNRWGQLIFVSKKADQGWDGNTKNGRAPQGTYRYKINFQTPEGNIKSQVGTFVLLRN